MAEIATGVTWAGIALLAAAYVWAFVLASRVSAAWFLGMLFLGWLLYPIFAAKNWAIAKHNSALMATGVTLVLVGLTILHLK